MPLNDDDGKRTWGTKLTQSGRVTENDNYCQIAREDAAVLSVRCNTGVTWQQKSLENGSIT